MRSGKHYKKLSIKGKKIDEHRFIMQQKLGRELGFNEVVHHKDEDKDNNSPENFELMSRAEHARMHAKNRIYGIEHSEKMHAIGIATMPNRKLTESQVIDIRKKYAQGTPPADLMVEYKIAKSTVFNIIWRTTWKHIA